MHLSYGVFSAEIPVDDEDAMLAFQTAMDELADATNKEIAKIGEEFGVTSDFASSIWYLRTRSRWTQELEDRLIQMSKAGETCPNMNEWPEDE